MIADCLKGEKDVFFSMKEASFSVAEVNYDESASP